jgi:hypothetical protein
MEGLVLGKSNYDLELVVPEVEFSVELARDAASSHDEAAWDQKGVWDLRSDADNQFDALVEEYYSRLPVRICEVRRNTNLGSCDREVVRSTPHFSEMHIGAA